MRAPVLLGIFLELLVGPLGGPLAPVCAEAAILRPLTELRGPVIRLSDLFDDLGTAKDRALGTAPPPGQRLVVEAPQLAAIAREFGVAWKPASNADRAVLERPGRPLARAPALQAVRAALAAAGIGADYDITLDGFAAPLVPLDSQATPLVSQLVHDEDSGRFSAFLSVAGDGMDPVQVRITGRADAMVVLPVTTGRLNAGTVLQAQDLRMGRVRASLVHGDVAEQSSEALGKELRHAVQAGQPLSRADLTLPTLVLKGHSIQMSLRTPGLEVVGEGVALESAGLGQHVKVLNPVSRAVLDAEVTGTGEVRVDPDTPPIQPAGRLGRNGINIQGTE